MAVTMDARQNLSMLQAVSQLESAAAESKRSVSAVYVKTRKCRFFGLGVCTRGNACTFAHTRDELRLPPDFFRTKLCPAVTRGDVCTNPRCKFAHAREERRKLSTPSHAKETTDAQDADTDYVKEDRCSLGSGAQFVEPAGLEPVSEEGQTMEETGQQQHQTDVHRRRGCRAGRRRSKQSVGLAKTSADPTENDAAGESPCPNGLNDIESRSSEYLKSLATETCTSSGMLVQESDHEGNPPCPYGTSICPTLISTGECTNPDCNWAHSIEDLRAAYKKQAASSKSGLPNVGTIVHFSREITASTEVPHGSADVNYQDLSDCESCSFSTEGVFRRARTEEPAPASEQFDNEQETKDALLCVRNTFLTFEPSKPLECRLRRVHSAPGYLEKLGKDAQHGQDMQEHRRKGSK